MKPMGATLLSVLATSWAVAHPHPGGVVVRPDGSIMVGDILQPRLLVIEPDGRWREIRGVGHVREIDQSADGTAYVASLRGGEDGNQIWSLGPDERPRPAVWNFYGIFALTKDGSFILAPGDAHDRRPTLELQAADGRRRTMAALRQIDALAIANNRVIVSDQGTIRTVGDDGVVASIAERVGAGIQGMAIGPNGPVVAAFDDRSVIEVTLDGNRRVLLTSEPPWGPTDVALRDGMLYVVEYARHPCCWKGPRVRTLVVGQAPQTLLIFDDQNHAHIWPKDRPLEWLVGGAVATFALTMWMARARHRRLRRRERES